MHIRYFYLLLFLMGGSVLFILGWLLYNLRSDLTVLSSYFQNNVSNQSVASNNENKDFKNYDRNKFNQNLLNDNLYYPNAEIVSKNETEVVLQTSDSAEKVTYWYKEKFAEYHFTIRSSINTNTNGNILNKLAVSDGKREVHVEIKKMTKDAHVQITLAVITFYETEITNLT